VTDGQDDDRDEREHDHPPEGHTAIIRTRIFTVSPVNIPSEPVRHAVVCELSCNVCGEHAVMKLPAHHVLTVIRELQAAVATDPAAFTELVPASPPTGGAKGVN
jgi:hypothetical protein